MHISLYSMRFSSSCPARVAWPQVAAMYNHRWLLQWGYEGGTAAAPALTPPGRSPQWQQQQHLPVVSSRQTRG